MSALIDLTTLKNASQNLFEEAKFPDKSEESWRDLDLRSFKIDDFNLKSEIETSIECSSSSVEVFNKKSISQNKKFNEVQSILENSDLDYFDLLNSASYSNYHFIIVNSNANETIKIKHKLKFGNAVIPKLIIFADSQSKLQIVEEFISDKSDEPVLWVPKTDIVSNDNANIEYTAIMHHSPKDWNFSRLHSHLKKDSRILNALFHVGASKSKIVHRAYILEKGATYRGIGIRAGANNEVCDVDMFVSHLASHTQSSLMYKTVLTNRARSMFTGNLDIEKGLKDVDSFQENHNILLSDEARAQSMPHLIIKAEDVACEHGATVGALDEHALFYLLARGIPKEVAKLMLIEAFLKSLIQEISSVELQEQVTQLLLSSLSLENLLES